MEGKFIHKNVGFQNICPLFSEILPGLAIGGISYNPPCLSFLHPCSLNAG